MRTACCLLISFCLALAAGAQKNYFLYFQTEGAAPFYVKMGDKVISSNTTGYLLLSELPDSIYTVAIGFPSVPQESRFRIPVSGNDRGFLIRNPGRTPVLNDLQSMALINPAVEDSDRNLTYRERTDSFTTLLSQAAGDPGLVYVAVRSTPAVQTPAVVQDSPLKKDSSASVAVVPVPANGVPEVKKETPPPLLFRDTLAVAIAPAVKEDTIVVVTNNTPSRDSNAVATSQKSSEGANGHTTYPPLSVLTDSAAAATDTAAAVVVNEEPYRRSVVKKHSESSTGEGFGLVYYDNTSAGIDTIRLLIPNPRITFHAPDTSAVTDGQMLDLKKESNPILKDTAVAQAPSAPVVSCKAIATDADFFKLRKSMAAKGTDEAMVDEARKSFRSRCFSTEQVKNLGSLFLTSAGKYQFFDAAYLHVSDPAQFPALSSEIRDDYYLKRFKALVGQ